MPFLADFIKKWVHILKKIKCDKFGNLSISTKTALNNQIQSSMKIYMYTAEPPTDSEFLSLLRLLADFLSHLGKWVKLIKFEAENEFLGTWKVEKPQSTSSTP